MKVSGLLVLLCGALAAVSSPARAGPNPRRFAVVVGSNRAPEGRQTLRYAHRDAESIAAALVAVGEFPADQVRLMLEPEPGAVTAALDGELERIRALGGETLLLFYFSGHGDQQALYPGGKPLPLEEVRGRLESRQATVRIGVIDACRGGAWTRTKGLTPQAPFEIHRPMALESEGSLLIASSSGQESAHETEALEGSFFTHHLVAGMLGAADRDGDAEVTADEAFRYARELTVRDTALQAPQPQHPSFDVQLRGRNDLALARVAAGPGSVTVRQTRGPLQFLSASTGIALLELPAGPQTVRVILPAGRYLVARRSSEGSYATELTVDPRQSAVVDEASLRPTELARLASKAPEGPPPLNRLSVEMAYFPPTVLNLQYERSFGPYWSAFVKPSVTIGYTDRKLGDTYEDHGVGGVGGELGGRFFPLASGPRGLWLSASAAAIFTRDPGRQSFGAAVDAGYTLAFWNRLEVSLGGGVAYLRARTPQYEESGPLVMRNLVIPDLRFAVGAGF